MKQEGKVKIIIFSVLYFMIAAGVVYYFFFRSKSDKSNNQFRIENNNYTVPKTETEESKFSVYDAEDVNSSNEKMGDYFKKIKDEGNKKQRYSLDGKLIENSENIDSIDQFGNPFDFNTKKTAEDDIYRQLQIRDSLNLLSYQEKRKRESYSLDDEINPTSAGYGKRSTTGNSYNTDTQGKSNVNRSNTEKTEIPRPIFYQDPMFNKNDPYYFHYPLDSNLTYQPLYQYTRDSSIWEKQENYENSLDRAKDNLSLEKKQEKVELNPKSPTAKQMQVNKNFPIQSKEYPDNYFTELTSVDQENADPYFFDNQTETYHAAVEKEVIGRNRRTTRNIKKLCVCEVVGDQFVRSGRQIPVRMKEDCVVESVGKFQQGTVFTALVDVQDNRMTLTLKAIIRNGYLYEFKWKLYDTDAREGIYIQNYNRALSIPARVAKDVYSTAIKSYEAAVVAYAANAQQGNNNLTPFELFSLDKLQESGFGEIALLSFIKELTAGLERPAVFLRNKYRLYLDISVGRDN